MIWRQEGGYLGHKRLAFVMITTMGLLSSCGPEEVPPSEGLTPSPTNTAIQEANPPAATATMAKPSPTPTNERPLAATVNGQSIPLADYQKEMTRFEAAMVGQGFDLESEDGKARLAQMRRQVLDSMIEQVLIEQAAAQEGVTISEEELEAVIQQSIEEGGGQAIFEEWLRTSDLTYEEFQEELRFQLLALAIFERITGSVPTTAEQVHARHILVQTKEEAQTILTRLQAGEDFAALARERSQDENTKEAGGDLGFFQRGQVLALQVFDQRHWPDQRSCAEPVRLPHRPGLGNGPRPPPAAGTTEFLEGTGFCPLDAGALERCYYRTVH